MSNNEPSLAPSLLPPAPARWKGPPQPRPSALAVEERHARTLRPRSVGHRAVQLLRWADLRAPALVDPAHRGGVTRLAHVPWLAPPDALGDSDLAGLVAHLVARWPVPPGLLSVFDGAHEDADLTRFARVAACLGAGGGYRDVAALLPGELTRRAFAQLLVANEPTPIAALRGAQVRAYGGPAWLAEALPLHRSFARVGGAPVSLLAWLCRHAEPDALGHVLDYLVAVPTTLAGRTWASVRRLADAWHARPPTVVEATSQKRPFPASGIGGALPPRLAEWRLRELRWGLDLLREGMALGHCVATYAPKARAGQVSIWSARRSEQRCLTIEVRNGHREIVQVRGLYNRRPSPEEIRMLQAWAEGNGLVLKPAAVK